MKIIINFGIMRGGDHVYLLWIINNYNNNEVLFYNNVRDITNLDDRIIKKTDTRVCDVSEKLINSIHENHKIEIYSFESQVMSNNLIKKINTKLMKYKYNNKNYKITIVIRNPYNNFASLLKYLENGGNSNYVKNIVNNKNEFVDVWLSLANNILEHKDKYNIILYDKFITNIDYRKDIANKLDIKLINNNLIKSKFGKGSSFGNNNNNYNERYKLYLDNTKMQELLNNKIVTKTWSKIKLLF